MRNDYFIEPFPSNINREHFASWLTGFTDGEGSFIISTNNKKSCYTHFVQCCFQISLRADDFSIIELIRSYFSCGTIRIGQPSCPAGKKTKPCVVFRVSKLQSLSDIIVPHFDNFPLLAKKKMDFHIWKQAVLIQYQIMKRPTVYKKERSGKTTKYTDEEYIYIMSLKDQLTQVRKYDNYSSDIPILPSFKEPLPLFENIF